jgi:hypothetical protein
MLSYLMPTDSCFHIEARRHREGADETAGDSTTTTTVNGG